jgi:hypothetical protein
VTNRHERNPSVRRPLSNCWEFLPLVLSLRTVSACIKTKFTKRQTAVVMLPYRNASVILVEVSSRTTVFGKKTRRTVLPSPQHSLRGLTSHECNSTERLSSEQTLDALFFHRHSIVSADSLHMYVVPQNGYLRTKTRRMFIHSHSIISAECTSHVV